MVLSVTRALKHCDTGEGDLRADTLPLQFPSVSHALFAGICNCGFSAFAAHDPHGSGFYALTLSAR